MQVCDRLPRFLEAVGVFESGYLPIQHKRYDLLHERLEDLSDPRGAQQEAADAEIALEYLLEVLASCQ